MNTTKPVFPQTVGAEQQPVGATNEELAGEASITVHGVEPGAGREIGVKVRVFVHESIDPASQRNRPFAVLRHIVLADTAGDVGPKSLGVTDKW